MWPMIYRVSFNGGTWREIDADLFTINDDWIAFIKDERPVLTCVRDNLIFIEPVEAPAEAPFKLN
jgi:hypothetical protein